MCFDEQANQDKQIQSKYASGTTNKTLTHSNEDHILVLIVHLAVVLFIFLYHNDP